MSDYKIAGNDDIIAGWTEDEINNLELSFLHKMFSCKDPAGVDTTMMYARYMSNVELDPDNYPIFLKLLQFENHWVVDALIGGKDPETFFKTVQPNKFILAACFKMFTRWERGTIYDKSLLVLFGLIQACYQNSHDGYRIYPITISDINHFAKHLEDENDQTNAVNRTILSVLDRITTLNDPGSLPPANNEVVALATQANNIRGKFLDMTKNLNEAIPENLLKKGDIKIKEVAPTIKMA